MRLLLFLALSCMEYDFKQKEKPNAPGDDTSITDTSTPTDSSSHTDSGDTVETGNSTVTPELPVAVCDVTPNPVAPPHETANWIGENSYDPDGSAITDYDWTLSSLPNGSAATMPNGAENRLFFTPDLAGDYVGQLVVTNELGEHSEPCETTLESIPAEDLWVEMYWQYVDDDMDLHLIAPRGSYGSLDSDCYYLNCTPESQWFYDMDWGTAGYEGDDPSLDLDDITGTGPENINIQVPQTDGIYTVIVHDYQGSTPDVYGPNNVTVNVYLNGSLAWTDTVAISGDDSVNEFAEIDWLTGTVTSL